MARASIGHDEPGLRLATDADRLFVRVPAIYSGSMDVTATGIPPFI